MGKIKVVDVSFDRNLFPKSLYGDKPYRLSNVGLSLSRDIKEETEDLVRHFLEMNRFVTEGVFLRLDLFVDPNLEAVHLLEINSRLVDGWSAGFSLARVAGQKPDELRRNASLANFPRYWHLPFANRVYRSDFDFALRELNDLGVPAVEISDFSGCPEGEWIYYYGWDRPEGNDVLTAPRWGYEIENKIHLARFSRAWQGRQVGVPLGYCHDVAVWDEVPRDRVVFKFCEKHGKDSERAGTSVLYPSEVRKGRFVKGCYGRGTIVAQDMIHSFEIDRNVCQLVLLLSGATVVTGYVLWAPRRTRIITDAYAHAPLLWH